MTLMGYNNWKIQISSVINLSEFLFWRRWPISPSAVDSSMCSHARGRPRQQRPKPTSVIILSPKALQPDAGRLGG